MNISMNGKPISSFRVTDDSGSPLIIQSGKDCSLIYLVANHHGDYDSFWIACFQDGVEVSRYRAGSVDYIIWMDEQ